MVQNQINNYELSKRIKRLRKKRHLTQQELGGILNVTRGAIWQYENGIRIPTIEMLVDMSDVLMVDVNYLLGIEKFCISQDDENYGFNISKREIEFIKQLRKNKFIYNRLINSPYLADKIKL